MLVTGATKGLGYALAGALVASGDAVAVNSRDASRAADAAAALSHTSGGFCVSAPGDVSSPPDVARIFDEAEAQLGGALEVVVLNAGSNGYCYENLEDCSPEMITNVVGTNLTGVLLCCREALRRRVRHIFLVEGAGSDGQPTRLFATYGASKAGIRQLAASLNAEQAAREAERRAARGAGNSNGHSNGNGGGGGSGGHAVTTRVHTISPGLVQTELVASGRNAFGSTGRFFVNVLSEDAAVVAEEVVPKIRGVVASNGTGGARIEVLTPLVASRKLLSRFVLGTNKNRWYEE